MQTRRNQRNPKRSPKSFLRLGAELLLYALLIFSTPPVLSAAVFHIPAGDVPGLIAAINAANANGEENTMILEPGTYALTEVDNTTIGPSGSLEANGLPVITSSLTLRGAGAEVTSIARNTGPNTDFPPFFRILSVATAGTLILDRLTIRGGHVVEAGGGGILNEGSVTVIGTTIALNGSGSDVGFAGGGGVLNSGTMTIAESTITGNDTFFSGGGGIFNRGTMTISKSTIVDNVATLSDGGGIYNQGDLEIINSTIGRNGVLSGLGAGVSNAGILTVNSSTIADNNVGGLSGNVGGILNLGVVTLQNTILARNGGLGGPNDCQGIINSLGNNLIGDPGRFCSVTLQSSDRTGDPGLATFIDDGVPGQGRIPLLSSSQLIDTGSDVACPATDQLGTPRNGPCDIGAVEFYPVVNEFVALANITTAFDPSPVPSGPAGTFHITADFTNTSNQAIVHPFVEVVELSGENLLLNADGGAGGVGARLTLPHSPTTSFQPGASSTFEFLIGLQQREPFTFFVNMLGEPRTLNPFVSIR